MLLLKGGKGTSSQVSSPMEVTSDLCYERGQVRAWLRAHTPPPFSTNTSRGTKGKTVDKDRKDVVN